MFLSARKTFKNTFAVVVMLECKFMTKLVLVQVFALICGRGTKEAFALTQTSVQVDRGKNNASSILQIVLPGPLLL